MIPSDADFVVRAFGRGGLELGATWHKGEASAAIELLVWQDRFHRGECIRVEMVDLRQARLVSYPPWPRAHMRSAHE